jgi:hypothetical protein
MYGVRYARDLLLTMRTSMSQRFIRRISLLPMLYSKINTKVINVELTNEKKKQIAQTFGPVTRLIDGGSAVTCDVIIRNIQRAWSTSVFCVLVRLESPSETYYAIANAYSFTQAIHKAQFELRKVIADKSSSDMQSIRDIQKAVHKKYFADLFVAS